MNIKVIKEKGIPDTGGAYARTDVTVYVDRGLSSREQKMCVIHEVLECYAPMWPHPKYDELANFILNALEDLEAKK